VIPAGDKSRSRTSMIKRRIRYLLLLFFLSPSPGLGQTWENQGLYGGQIPALAVDPSDRNRLFAGSWEGDGLFKSTNGGVSWVSIEGFRNQDLRAIAIDPREHLATWAVSTSSIYKSRDGGLSWEQYDPARRGGLWRSYYSLALDPSNQDVVYVGCSGFYGSDDGGILFKTTDSGHSWEQLTVKADHIPWALAVNPLNNQEVWFVTDTLSSEDGSIYRSEDGGLTWNVIETNLTPGWFEEIVINPVNPSRVYAGGENGVYRTKDGGETWEQLLPDSWCEALILDPQNPETIYAAWNLNFSKSTDGGDTWTTQDLSSEDLPLEFFSLALDPQDPDVIYGGDSNLGVFKSEDGGITWIPINQGIKANAVSCSTINPQNSGEIYSGTIAGLYRRREDGSWNLLNPRNTFSFSLDPSNSEILYAGFNWGLEKSTDGGLSWEEILSLPPYDPSRVESIAINREDAKTIYAGVFYYSGRRGTVYKSIDGGESWTKVLWTSRPINVVEIDLLNPSAIYAGSGHLKEPTLPGNLYKSVDGGENWGVTGLKEKVVNTIALNPQNSEIMYAGTSAPEDSVSAGLYKSIDEGLNWEEKSKGLPHGATVTAVRIDSSNTEIVYAATQDQGIYITLNGGEYWTLLGLSDYRSYDLLLPFLPEVNLSSHLSTFFAPAPLYAGTGSGLLQYDAAGIGMIEGMIVDCPNEQGVNEAEVRTDTGGAALSLDGYYLMMVPAGICTVTAHRSCYQTASVDDVLVSQLGITPVDFCLNPQDGISGKVTSKSEAIEGARVALKKERVKAGETSTDEDGYYEFTALEAGTYTLSVSKEGYRSAGTGKIPHDGASCVIKNFEMVKK
jgi:photosystem II stability/assembly factor-like uncharacterized protein